MNDLGPAGRDAGNGGRSAMLGICTAILVVTGLYFAGGVFAPLAFGLFIIAIVWPLQAWLQAWVPKLLALLVSMIATVVVLAAFLWTVSWGLSRVAHFMIDDAARFQILYGQISTWLDGHGIEVAGLWDEHFNVGWLLRLFQEVTARVNGMLSFSIVVLIYVILGLLEVDVVATRLGRMNNQEAGSALLAACTRTGLKFRRYMLVRTLMSVMTGVLVWGFVALSGLPLAQEWGVIAFALNYIPVIGPLFATVMPSLFAVVQFDTWQAAALVFVCLNLIQFLVGSALEPRIAGTALAMSPFLVLFAVFFWTFVWNVAGAFIGVPIVIAVLTFCEQSVSCRWVADMFGAPPGART